MYIKYDGTMWRPIAFENVFYNILFGILTHHQPSSKLWDPTEINRQSVNTMQMFYLTVQKKHISK